MAELIKEFTNSMRLNGQVARIAKLAEGKDKNDKEYVSYRGALKVGGEEGHLYDFEGMCYKFTKDGKPTKSYERAVNWFSGVYDAIQNDKEIPEVFVSLSGSLEPRDYVGSDGALKEINAFRANQILDYAKDPNGDDAYVAIDGYIRSLKPEIDPKTEEETGRYIMSLVSATFRNEAIVIPKILVEDEAVDYVTENFETGSYVRITLGFKWTSTSAPTGKVGIGRMKTNVVSRVTRDYYLMGMDIPLEDDDVTENKKTMKSLMSERQLKLDEIVEEGYKGSKDSGSKVTKGFPKTSGGKSSASMASPVDEDDIPF
jgi:hypothetical protein